MRERKGLFILFTWRLKPLGGLEWGWKQKLIDRRPWQVINAKHDVHFDTVLGVSGTTVVRNLQQVKGRYARKPPNVTKRAHGNKGRGAAKPSLSPDDYSLLNAAGGIRLRAPGAGRPSYVQVHIEGTQPSQAQRIIERFGGVYQLSASLKVVGRPRSPSTIYRWLRPSPKGSNGMVPLLAMLDILAAAQHEGIRLGPEETSLFPTKLDPVRKLAFPKFHGKLTEGEAQAAAARKKQLAHCRRIQRKDRKQKRLAREALKRGTPK